MASPLLPFTGGLRLQAPSVTAAFEKAARRAGVTGDLYLIDPFLGGGSISHTAKQRGFVVHSGDLARRSFFLGKALIENEIEIGPEAVSRLLRDNEMERDFEGVEALATIDTTHLHLARRMWWNAENDTERYLAQRVMLDLVPSGGFGPFKATDQNPGAIEAREKVAKAAENIVATVDKRRKDINAGIFKTGKAHTMSLSGAFELIARGPEWGVSCVHLDPPTYGNENYMDHYEWQDWLVGDDDLAERSQAGGAITKKNALDFLDECVRLADYAAVVIVTMQEIAYKRGDAADVLKRYGRKVAGYELPSTTRNPFWMILGTK